MGYLRPTNAPITGGPSGIGSWQGHKNRKPPSGMPGVDYACARNTPLWAGDDGVVTYVNYSTASSSGRGVDIRFKDGRTAAYIHLSKDIRVKVGDEVKRGQVFALSGSSARGSENGVDPHVHVTLWSGIPWQSTNIDFEKYVGASSGSGSGAGGITNPGPMQRIANDLVKRRIGAPSIIAPVGPENTWLKKGALANFVGWLNGDRVDNNSVWFKGTSGDFFWSGAFVGGPNTTGLPDLNPTAPVPSDTQRVVGINEAHRRIGAPSIIAPKGESLAPGTIGNFKGWVNGDNVQGNNVWFVGISGDFFWSGGFTSHDKGSLPDLNSTLTPPEELTLDPSMPWKSGTPDSPLAKWIGSPNYGYRDAKAKDHVTLHWMEGTLAGTDATFQNPGTISKGFSVKYKDSPYGRGTSQSTQYGIGLSEIHQYVAEDEYAHGDGNTESNASGISIEHQGSTTTPVADSTYKLSAMLLADIARRHGWTKYVWMVNIFPHNHWAATSCPGTLDTARLIQMANALLEPIPPVEGVVISEALYDIVKGLPQELRALANDIETRLPKDQ